MGFQLDGDAEFGYDAAFHFEEVEREGDLGGTRPGERDIERGNDAARRAAENQNPIAQKNRLLDVV